MAWYQIGRKNVTRMSVEPNPKDTADPAAILLLCIILGGSVPFSPAQIWETRKASISMMPTTSVATT